MIDRRWVPLGIRIVGLYVAGSGIQGALRSVGDIFQWMDYYRDTTHSGSIVPHLAVAIACGLQLVIGIVLLVKASALAKRWVGDVNKRCPACLTDIRGVEAGVCPECGGPIKGSVSQQPSQS